MERTLVIGATGQLGRAVIAKLLPHRIAVRALVRDPEAAAEFEALGVEPVRGDLTDADSLKRACHDIATIVATATAAVPTRPTDRFHSVDRDGYRNLILAAQAAGVRRFVYTSAPQSAYEHLSPLLQAKRHTENALAVTNFLATHKGVSAVHYPGLRTHPGHEVAARQMRLFGGMASFEVRGGRAEAMAMSARCRVFTRATSLGGTESLIEHRASIEGPATRAPEGLLRLSIGLEHPDDLIDDLKQALAAS